MDSKKDPGKFTVRFSLSDPQQRQAAELLNRQGRSKAQFITNAVLYYTSGGQTLVPQGAQLMDGEQIRRLVEDILAQQGTQAVGTGTKDAGERSLYDADRNVIFKTLEAFQQQKGGGSN